MEGVTDGQVLRRPLKRLVGGLSEALSAAIGGGRKGHGGRSAVEGRASRPPSSAACSCRTRAPIGATLAEARRRSFTTGVRAATLNLQIFSDSCRTLLPSHVPTYAYPSRCPRAGVALASTTRRASSADQVECPETLENEPSGKVWKRALGWRHRRRAGAAEPSPLGGWACPAARGASARAVCVERGRAGP